MFNRIWTVILFGVGLSVAQASAATTPALSPREASQKILALQDPVARDLIEGFETYAEVRHGHFGMLDHAVRSLGERIDGWLARVSEPKAGETPWTATDVTIVMRAMLASTIDRAQFDTDDYLRGTGILIHAYQMSHVDTRRARPELAQTPYKALGDAALEELVAVGVDAMNRFDLELGAEPLVTKRSGKFVSEVSAVADLVTRDLRAVQRFPADESLELAQGLGRALAVDLRLYVDQIRATPFAAPTDAALVDALAERVYKNIKNALRTSAMSPIARTELIAALTLNSTWIERLTGPTKFVVDQIPKTRQFADLLRTHDPVFMREFAVALKARLLAMEPTKTETITTVATATSRGIDETIFADQSASVRMIGLHLAEMAPAREPGPAYDAKVLRLAQSIDEIGRTREGDAPKNAAFVAARLGTWLNFVDHPVDTRDAAAERGRVLAERLMDLLETELALIDDDAVRLDVRRELNKRLVQQSNLFRVARVMTMVLRPFARKIDVPAKHANHVGSTMVSDLQTRVRASCDSELTRGVVTESNTRFQETL